MLLYLSIHASFNVQGFLFLARISYSGPDFKPIVKSLTVTLAKYCIFSMIVLLFNNVLMKYLSKRLSVDKFFGHTLV